MIKCEYLTENRLGLFLNEHIKEGEWIHDKNFCGRIRPDYRNESMNMIVEFDGEKHYTNTKRIVKDNLNMDEYEKSGYKVIRIPYFIQLSSDVIEKLFGIKCIVDNHYPHGFIDKKCVLPCDFCEMGLDRFESDLKRFDFLKTDICKSLNDKIEEHGCIETVIPRRLLYLI